MKIENVRIYGIGESLKASGYPMSTNVEEWDTEWETDDIEITENNLKRGIKLGNAISGSGHDCMLKGCIVQYDLQAPEFFWRQFDRYHFHDYVSSQSKMHCILKFDIDKMCNEYVDQRVINIINEYINLYNNYETLQVNPEIYTKDKLFQKIISNCPMGLELTARITSNYLQLKSIYNQRKTHKLEQWHYYCDWIKSLPHFEELCLKGE